MVDSRASPGSVPGLRKEIMRRSSIIGFAILATLLLAPRARALPSLAPDLPGRVVPGQEIALRWSDLPAGVTEVEVLLSLDGGRSFPLRASRETDARDGAIRWRVPDFATGAAVLMLRMGTRSGEIPGPHSRVFAIGDPGATDPAALARFRPGVREAALWGGFEPFAGPTPASLAPPQPRRAALESAPSSPPPDPVGLAAPAPRLSDRAPCAGRRPMPTMPAPALPPARLQPLRI